jgi:hypothetical protein
VQSTSSKQQINKAFAAKEEENPNPQTLIHKAISPV